MYFWMLPIFWSCIFKHGINELPYCENDAGWLVNENKFNALPCLLNPVQGLGQTEAFLLQREESRRLPGANGWRDFYFLVGVNFWLRFVSTASRLKANIPVKHWAVLSYASLSRKFAEKKKKWTSQGEHLVLGSYGFWSLSIKQKIGDAISELAGLSVCKQCLLLIHTSS